LVLSSNRVGCCRTGIWPDHASEAVFRRLPGYLRHSKAVFPEILSRRFRIAGTYCRQRWFAKYARSESLLRAWMARQELQPIYISKSVFALRG